MGTYYHNGNFVSGDTMFSVKSGTTIITLTWSSVRGAGIKDYSDSVVYDDPSFLWEVPASDYDSIMCDDLGVLWEGVIKDCNDGVVSHDLGVLWEVLASKTLMISLYVTTLVFSETHPDITVMGDGVKHQVTYTFSETRYDNDSIIFEWRSRAWKSQRGGITVTVKFCLLTVNFSERWCHQSGGIESSTLSSKPRFRPSFLRYDHHVVQYWLAPHWALSLASVFLFFDMIIMWYIIDWLHTEL